MTRAEITYNSIVKEIEKLETRIERESERQEKKIEKAKKLNVFFENCEDWCIVRDSKTLTDNQYEALFIVSIHDRELNDLNRSLEKAHRRLAKAEEVLNKEIEKDNEIEENKVDKIEQFLDSWLENAIEFYTKNGKLTDTPNYANGEISEKDLIWERNRKSKYITSQVIKRVGKIVDTGYLYIASDGNINGKIIGEKGSVVVETIIAGGYNIQCRHFRVLFK